MPNTEAPWTDPEYMRQVYDRMETEFPELWRICYPRIYEEPRGCGAFYSPKTPSRQLTGVALKVQGNLVGESEQYEFIASSHLIRNRLPMFWLSQDMATAIRQTMPPQAINWYEMPLPFEAGVFMLPKGSLVHPDEGDIAFVAYMRLRAGEQHISPLVRGMPYGSVNGGMIFLALSMTGGHLFHWNLPLSTFGPTLRIPDIDSMVMEHTADEHQSGFTLLRQPHMTEADNRLLAEVGHYVFGALLLMNARPALVTTGVLRKRVPGKNGPPKEFWSPNILGEHYKIKREAEPQGGHHNSPRVHWVRGYYREQGYGAGREMKKDIWIEPFLRGA